MPIEQDAPTKPTQSAHYWNVLWSVCNELREVRAEIDAAQLDWAMTEVKARLMKRQGGRTQTNGRVE